MALLGAVKLVIPALNRTRSLNWSALKQSQKVIGYFQDNHLRAGTAYAYAQMYNSKTIAGLLLLPSTDWLTTYI